MALTCEQNIVLLGGVLVMAVHSSFTLYIVVAPYFLSKIHR